MAGGCTGGNGISQGLQLAVVGGTFLVVTLASGFIAAWALFRPARWRFGHQPGGTPMFPIAGAPALVLAVVFGAVFGWLLHRAGRSIAV